MTGQADTAAPRSCLGLFSAFWEPSQRLEGRRALNRLRVPTRDFWRERRGYYNCVDFDLSTKSMNKVAGLADIVVPGHANFFPDLTDHG